MPDARCVGGAEAGPEGAIYDMVLEKGIVRLWFRVGGPDAERELGLGGSLPVLQGPAGRSPATMAAKWSFDFTYKDGKLTLSNPRGWRMW